MKFDIVIDHLNIVPEIPFRTFCTKSKIDSKIFTETSHMFCLFLTQHDTVTASFVIFVMCLWQQPIHVMGRLLQHCRPAMDSWCPQNSLILSNKHCWWMLRPVGGDSVGRAACGWTPRLHCKSNHCLSSDGCFLANTTLGSSDVNLIQNKHNGLNFPYT